MTITFKKETIEISPETTHQKISNKLIGLGIKGFKIKAETRGPLVTSYPLELSSSTPIAKLLSKAEDIALAVGVDFIDIKRVKNEVVLFIPNENREIVDFKDALHWYLHDEKVREMKLPILLGMDYIGNKSALDLFEQPHILMAGSTGSGKSIFESSIIASLTTIKSKEKMELYLVDTKRVDLTLFENLPHLKEMAKDEDDWYILINSLYSLVQKRNREFEFHGVRNIIEYNSLCLSNEQKPMPFCVLIIDELSDLIEKDKLARVGFSKRNPYPEPTVEDSLKRVIQICRASGVHIIACTQRTSVDVISGTIKANFPTRISLRLPTGIDSRTILGTTGAENLLGKGDMLIQRADSDIVERFHGPFVRLEDIEAVINQQDLIRDSIWR